MVKKTNTKKVSGAGLALPTMEDEFEVPQPVQQAADRYAEQLRKANRAKVKKAELMHELVDVMEAHDVQFVWIYQGQKVIRFSKEGKIKIETPKKTKKKGSKKD